MGLLKKLLGLQHVWLEGENPCPTCGRLIQILINQPFEIDSIDIELGEIRTGVQCQKCSTMYHNRCAPDQCFCGSSSFQEVVIESESPPCYGSNEEDNCEGCSLLKRFCRCDFYEKWKG